MQDARADVDGEPGEHVVVALVLERHPDEARGRGRQQQRAERAVDRAVGDVEQAVTLGALDELVVQPLARASAPAAGNAGRRSLGDRRVSVVIVGAPSR